MGKASYARTEDVSNKNKKYLIWKKLSYKFHVKNTLYERKTLVV